MEQTFSTFCLEALFRVATGQGILKIVENFKYPESQGQNIWAISGSLSILRFKYTTKFSLPKIACPAIVYAEIVVVIDPFFVGVCP